MIRKHVASLALLAAAVLGACSETTTAPSADARLGSRLRVWVPDSAAVLANEGVSGLGSATQIVAGDSLSWRALWQAIYANRSPQPSVPAVNFASHSVIVYGLGARYASLQLDSITHYQLGSAAYLTQTTPGSSCVVPGVVLTPAIAVDVPEKVALQAWLLRTVVHECS